MPIRKTSGAASYRSSCLVALCLAILLLQLLSSVSERKWMKLYEYTTTSLSFSEVERTQADSSQLLPDWRIVTDCSAYDLSCPAMKLTQNTYSKYPFRFPVKYERDYEWKNLSVIPEEWAKHFESSTPSEKAFVSADLLPEAVSKKEYDKCLEHATTKPYEEQLDDVLQRLKRHPELDMVAFTMADYKYATDMMHEIFQMNDAVVGFEGSFFMVALDKETVDLACRYGYPVVASPGVLNKDREEKGLRANVQSTKFLVSHDLVQRNASFLFYEMDIWFLQSPEPVLSKMEGDMICSVHQDNPFAPNIGAYAVKANPATLEFFHLCSSLLEAAPDTHDQHVYVELWSLAEVILRGEKIEEFTSKAWEPSPPPIPDMKHPIRTEFFDSLAFAASVHPVPHEKTIAIHPLCGAPLRSPHGKKMIAKELGGWYGFQTSQDISAAQGGYYLRTGDRRRYLMLDGRVLGGYSTVMAIERHWANYHNGKMASWTIAFLVSLARRTNRILILPKLASDHQLNFFWQSLDLESLDNLIDYRETNFPNNHKSWYSESTPFKTVARTALGLSWEPTDQWKLFAQLPADDDIHAWKLDIDSPIEAWFGYMSSPEINDAELLLVNPQFLHAETAGTLIHSIVTNDSNPVVHEIQDIANYRLRWCGDVVTMAMSLAHWTTATFQAETDCYGEGKAWQER